MRTKKFQLVRSFLSLKFTAFLVLLLMFNCQKDDTVAEPTQNINQSRYDVKIVNKDFFENNSDLTRKLEILNPKPKGNIDSNSGLNREIYNEEYGFTIETDFVKYVEEYDTGRHSYSFPLIRDIAEDDKLENLVFQSNDLGTYDAFIVKYGFTKEEYEFLGVEQLDNLSTKYTSIVFDELDLPTEDNLRVYYSCMETWEYVTSEEHNGDLHGVVGGGVPEAGTCATDPSCPYGTTSLVLTSMTCTSGGGGGYGNDDGSSSTGGYNDNTTNGTNTTGGGTTNSQYPFISSPTTIQPWQEVLQCIGSVVELDSNDDTTLTIPMIQWLQENNKPGAGLINQYLEQNSCSEESQAFAIAAIEAMDNGCEVDFENEVFFNEGCSEGYSLNSDGDCEQNPILSADCRSFEFYQPPGEPLRACAVTNLFTNFYAYGVKDGNTGVFEVFVRYPILYFTAPSYMTNGYAANQTAQAVTNAIRDTELWYATNPYATKEQVGLRLDLYLTTRLALFGGTWRLIPPFDIPSAAPYLSSLTGPGNCN